MAGKKWLAVLTLVLSAHAAAGNAGAGQLKAAACMACHGTDGNSLADLWPKLAGQLPEYLVKQLKDFKAGRRRNEIMSPQAAKLAEADMADIAAFFAAQQAAPNEIDKSLLARGEQLFRRGRGRPKPVTACVGCHGLEGSGDTGWRKTQSRPPVVLAPSLAGQHAPYLEGQLMAFRSGTRANDVAGVMREIARGLDDGEIAALAAYAASLKP